MSVSYAELEGLRGTMTNYTVFRDMMPRKLGEALARFALKIVDNAKARLKEKGNIAKGALRQSGSVRPQIDGTIQAGFSEGYAYFVEYGRRAGGFPPLDKIEEWVEVKHRQGYFSEAATVEERKEIAYLIARRIAKKGTNAHPFLMPAVAQERKGVSRFWVEAYKEAVNDFDK